MSGISKKILVEIERNHVKPKSRTYFVLRETVFWVLSVVFMFLGSILFSAVLHRIFEGRFSEKISVIDEVIRDIFYLVPVFWFFVIFAFLLFGFYNYKCTSRSYKYRKRYVLTAFGLIIIVLGTIFYIIDFGEAMNKVFF